MSPICLEPTYAACDKSMIKVRVAVADAANVRRISALLLDQHVRLRRDYGGFRAGTLGTVIGRVMTHPDRHVVAFSGHVTEVPTSALEPADPKATA